KYLFDWLPCQQIPEACLEQLFLGGHRAIDFLNTKRAPDGVEIETIGSGAAFAEWLVAAGCIEAEPMSKLARRFGSTAMNAAAADARGFREWSRDWLPGLARPA